MKTLATAILLIGLSAFGQSFQRNPATTNADTYLFITNTVAGLGTPSGAAIKYCSDALTSQSLGGYVRWDGSHWKTWEYVTATADPRTFILNCYAAGISAQTPISTIYFASDISSVGSGFLPFTSVFSGGASVGLQGGEPSQAYLYLGTGTAGGAAIYSLGPPLVSGTYYSSYSWIGFDALSNVGDEYWFLFGTANNETTNYPTSGAFFLYDRGNHNSHNLTVGNWIATTCQGGSYTYADTGLAVTTTSSANRLAVILTTTNAVFYTNGVAAVTSTGTLPTLAQRLTNYKMVRVAGTTGRFTFFAPMGLHMRRATPRPY